MSSAGHRPALAVIVRTLGRPGLAEALDSLARQTHRDFEAIVVDMSRGGLGGVLEEARLRLPGVKHIPVGKPLNRAEALNVGIARADAAAIGILDDDNLYGPDHVATLVRGLASSGADLVYTPVRRQTLTVDGALIEERIVRVPFSRPRLMFGNYIFATGTAFSREIWERVGGYDPRFPVYEDWDFLIRVAYAGRILAIEGRDAISRNFTGDPAKPAHHGETADCARSMAGIFWKHRRHYTDTLFVENPRLAAKYPRVPRRGYQAGTARWLVGWWWQAAFVRGRSRS